MTQPLTLLERKRGFLSALSIENTQLLLLVGFAFLMFSALTILGRDTQKIDADLPDTTQQSPAVRPDIVPEEAARLTENSTD